MLLVGADPAGRIDHRRTTGDSGRIPGKYCGLAGLPPDRPFSALPWYLIALHGNGSFPKFENLIIALSITSWVASCRIVRGMALSIREQETLRRHTRLLPTWRILANHIFPRQLRCCYGLCLRNPHCGVRRSRT